MSDPSLAMQDAVEAALRDSAAVKTAFGGTTRLYTLSAPVGAPFPHLIIGEDQVIGDDTECGPASEMAVIVHVYARADDPVQSRRQAKIVAGAVRGALTRALPMDGHVVIDWTFETIRHLTDPDGLTAHSVVEMTYATAPAD